LRGRENGDDDTAQRRERRVPATVRGRRTGGDMAGSTVVLVAGRTNERTLRAKTRRAGGQLAFE